jgi:hypothetical protein
MGKEWRLTEEKEATKKMTEMNKNLARLVKQMGREACQVLFNELFPQVMSGEYPSVLDQLYGEDYRWKPVDVRTFLLDPEYLGKGLGKSVYPRIIDDLEELFEGEFSEVLLTGGIGWGKTRMAEFGIAYELYVLSCMRDPAARYGLIPDSVLAFLNVSVTQSQARRVLFRGLFDLIRRSPYFREQFPCEPNIFSEIRFLHNVVCYPVASTESSMLGEGVFSAAFDEMNFMPVVEHSKHQPEGGTYDHAVVLYNRLSRRIRSRMNQRGRLPGHLWLISSARYPNDFTERKAAEAKTDERIFVRHYPTWGTRPKHHFMAGTFKVEAGDSAKRSRVLNGDESDVNIERVIDVPVDFKEEFQKDPDGAVRDYAGISILSTRPFIVRRDLVARMFQLGEEQGLKHPFSKLDVTLQDESEVLLAANLHWIEQAKINEEGRILLGRATLQPMMTRKLYSAMYFAHVDLARTTDACGVAIGHIVGSKQVQRGFGPSAKIETKPVIRVDMLLRVVAPPHGEILAANVRGLFYQLSELGMQFGKVSYDRFGSLESIQTLNRQGFPAEIFSVDANLLAFEQLRSALYDERVLCYRVPKLEDELVHLELDTKRGKVDHPPRGSKDLADALAGVIAHCEQNFVEMPVPLSLGSTCPESDIEEIWAKVGAGIPISEQEFDRL